MRTRIKICGITNIEDALACAEFGADAIGFVFAESPRHIEPEKALEIANQLPPFVQAVGVFTAEDETVAQIANFVKLDFIQLHGDQSDEFAAKFESKRIIRAVRVKDELSLVPYKYGATYLLDTWKPGVLGGTGATFNWELAVKAKEFDKPIILAGGLSMENIADAIRIVRPYAVDVSSGVEISPGKKDRNKIKEFIRNVRAADATTE